MSDFKIIDKSGVWVTNTSQYPLVDHERASNNPGETIVSIQPGVPTKIKLNGYLEGQPTLEVLTVDPISGDAIKPAKKVGKVDEAKVEADAKAEAKGETTKE